MDESGEGLYFSAGNFASGESSIQSRKLDATRLNSPLALAHPFLTEVIGPVVVAAETVWFEAVMLFFCKLVDWTVRNRCRSKRVFS